MRSAGGTDADKLDPAFQNLVAVGMNKMSLLNLRGDIAQVIEPPAVKAPDMMMVLSLGVETGLRAPDLDLSDYIVFNENFQIPIDRPEADFGQAFANNGIQFGGRGVAGQLSQLLVYHPPLLCIPLCLPAFHYCFFSLYQ
jgi:hypothetical protein